MKYSNIIVCTLLLVMCFINSASGSWILDSSRVEGLSSGSALTIGYNVTGDSNWTLLSSSDFGSWYGFYWNGTSWVSDSSRIAGLSNVGLIVTPDLAYNVTGDGNWTLIAGEDAGNFNGFYWNGTSWVSDSSRIAGLGDIGSNSRPEMTYNIFNDNKWTLISGSYSGNFHGFYWNGTSWVSDSSRIAGLSTSHTLQKVTIAYNVINDDNKWDLIYGEYYGAFSGYYQEGDTWVSDSSRVSGLADIGYYSIPEVVYNLNGDNGWSLISVSDNDFYGFSLNHIPITSSILIESQTNPVSLSTNTSSPHFSWTYSDTDSDTQSSYEIYVGTALGLSDMWNSQVSSSNTYTTYSGTTLEEITTYYIQVRTNDGYENSDWVTGTFALKDTTTYSPPSTTGGTTGDTTSLDIYSEKISTPVIITEKITDTFAETDSLTFILYLVGALLGALIFGIITNNDNMINVVLTGTVGWVVTLVAVIINNLLELFVINSIITMILSVIFGFTIYVIHDQYTEIHTKSKHKRRPKK